MSGYVKLVVNLLEREVVLVRFSVPSACDPETTDESLSFMFPAQVVHGVNNCVCMFCRQVMYQTVQVGGNVESHFNLPP